MKIQAKLAVLMVALVVTLAGFYSISSATRLRREADAALERKAEGYGRLLARELEPAVAFADRETAREVFDAVATDLDVAGAALVGPSGPIASHGDLVGGAPTAAQAARELGGRIRVVAPVVSPEGPRGAVAIELSRESVLAAEARATRTAVVLGGAGVLVGLIAAWLIARSFARRVRAVAAAATAVAAGDLAQPDVRDGSRDEIGQLAGAFNAMLAKINGLVARIQADRAAEMRRVLEHVGQGLLVVDPEGGIAPERSAIADRWFGAPRAEDRLWDWLYPDDATARDWFALSWRALAEDVLPIALALDQLPRQVARGGQAFELEYTPVAGGATLVVITDVTARRARERADAEQRELAAAVARCHRDRAGWLEFIAETRALIATIAGGGADLRAMRALHTLKGNCGLFGLTTIAALAHAAETTLVEEGRFDGAPLARAWAEVEARVGILGETATGRVDLEAARFDSLVAAIDAGAAPRHLVRLARLCQYEPVGRRFERLAEAAQALATRLGKEPLDVTIDDRGLHLPAGTLGEFWAAAIHVVRNAVDHGIEPVGTRLGAGKPARGRLTLRAGVGDGGFTVEIADDGAGVDWSAVRAAAGGGADLGDRLLRGGLSTRAVVTDVSGRGVGLSAAREACERSGGRVELASAPGQGTTLRFSWPERVVEAIAEEPVSRAA